MRHVLELWPASQAFSSVVLLLIILLTTHALSPSPPSRPHNTAYSTSALPTTAASMDSMDVVAARARYVVVLV